MVLAYELAGGAFIFLAFLISGLLAVAYAYYSRSGSDISMRPSRGDRGDTDTSAMNDRSQPVSSWSHGTGGPHRRNLPPPKKADGELEDDLDPSVRAGLEAWRTRMKSPYTPKLAMEVDPGRDHVRGPDDAAVTVVSYTDFECPSCRDADIAIKRVLGEPGQSVRYVFRHFPLADAHHVSLTASETAEWAARRSEDDFWAVHDAVYKHKHAPSKDGLRKIVGKLDLDEGEYDAAIAAGELRARVAEDFASGVESGVNGTPTMFINGERYDEDFDEASLRKALASAGA